MHPNRLPFKGTLCFVDTVSDKYPSGSKRHKIIISSITAERALQSLIYMGVNCSTYFEDHDKSRKIGVITSARLTDKELSVEGILYAKDFQKTIKAILHHQDLLGMSFEAEASLLNRDSVVWKLVEMTFTGASILEKDKAAYSRTRIELL